MTQSTTKTLSREEIAKIEIGHTDSTRAIDWFLTLFFLAVIVAVPLAQLARDFAAIRAGKEPGRNLPQSLDVFSFLLPSLSEVSDLVVDGAAEKGGFLAAGSRLNNRMLGDIQRYETDLKNRDEVMQWVIPRMQVPVTAWLKGGNEDAYCSRDGWLFYRKDIDSLTGRGFLDPDVLAARSAGGSELVAPPQPDPVKAIVDFRDELQRRGITLVVVPTPVKPSIYPEWHSARYDGRSEAVQNPSFAAFKDRLAGEGIPCFDPAPLLVEAKAAALKPLYLKTDTHWTPAGMELVAEALAGFVRRTVELPSPAPDRFTASPREVTGRGDIAMMLEFPEEWSVFPQETVTVREVRDAAAAWRPDRDAKVLFLGDSFANIYSLAPMGWGETAGFAEQVSLALGLPLDTITRNDAGSHATREMLALDLERGTNRLAGKQVVIWEFAARELACGDWKIIPLAAGAKQPAATDVMPEDGGAYVPATGSPVLVRGVVKAASPAPRPGSVPYKDHVIMVHLGGLEAEKDPAAAGKEAVVFVWSMRDNKPTPAAGWRPGDKVSLELRPWAEVAAKYDAINRSELDDDTLLLAEPCWGETP